MSTINESTFPSRLGNKQAFMINQLNKIPFVPKYNKVFSGKDILGTFRKNSYLDECFIFQLQTTTSSIDQSIAQSDMDSGIMIPLSVFSTYSYWREKLFY